ncbi:helix-turn-helix domain-containing protein [Streptomyces sp. TP-A0874]|uniref:helix-turn-helix domain-containing protein n=1 Tax=Streptomyces sp. TP-A0874 TaxID=549819 RepID=UPI000853344F|nr:XRE family transcriptional regulator [Streptomyces sp. TP-A0874]
MPRWRALPDGLDPQLRELAEQLRGLVDHSGLSVALVADRTGYSKTSWERYLGGLLLPPRGAVVALAETAGANPEQLIGVWQVAEQAWNRSETGGGHTLEAIRFAQEGQAGAARKRRRRMTAVGVLAVVVLCLAAASAMSNGGSGESSEAGAGASPAPAVSGGPEKPVSSAEPTPGGSPAAEAKCTGAECDGGDPDAMGCAGGNARTVSTASVGAVTVEVRHSRACGAAWARITEAAPGDLVRINSGNVTQSSEVVGDEAYTRMVSAREPGQVRACVWTVGGEEGCTTPGQDAGAQDTDGPDGGPAPENGSRTG